MYVYIVISNIFYLNKTCQYVVPIRWVCGSVMHMYIYIFIYIIHFCCQLSQLIRGYIVYAVTAVVSYTTCITTELCYV